MEVIIQTDAEAASNIAARIVARQLRTKPDSVLGLATGDTPLRLYHTLASMSLDWRRVRTFNLDEYVGLPPDHPQSYHTFMHTHLFRHVNLPPGQAHVPDGMAADIPALCRRYEESIRAAGGIDLQILGIGSNGHIGFNEPPSSLVSRTRIKTLTADTVRDNARFFGCEADVPHHVITMGIGTIMEARQAILLGFGANKADALAGAIEGPLTAMNPASALQMHPAAVAILDEPAAARLSRADYYRWVYDHKPAWQRA
jgi:glucosamine-6-phosphate deaminase